MLRLFREIQRKLHYLFTLSPSINVVIMICLSILFIDNSVSYYISASINDLFEPHDATLMLIEFMIGLLNIVSFTSWYVQLELIMPDGVCPYNNIIDQWYYRYHGSFTEKFVAKPSVFWLYSSPTFVRIIGIIGIINGFIMCLLPFYSYSILILSICYMSNALLYSSYIDISGDFLMLQNDSEMVELNLLMFFCSFIRFRYPFITIFVYRWLSFRIMTGCGICKWFGSISWKQLTAMNRHYITQPLPNIHSFYLHHLAVSYHKLSVIFTFIIEGPLPFGIFGPSWSRYLAFIGFNGLILMINASGNFGYIGQLMMTETMALLDDNALPQFIIDIAINIKYSYLSGSTHWYWYEWITIPLSVIIIILYVIGSWYPLTETVQSNRYSLPITNNIINISKRFRRYRFGNKYAKFGSMNSNRYEFIIEGSNDMIEWKTYHFIYKPSLITDKPSFVMLHLPRLDWRIWFLPLYWAQYLSYNDYNNYYQPPEWFYKVIQLLHENNNGILKLIKYNPFPIHPPQHIRCIVKKFDFVSKEERNRNKNVWYQEMLMTNTLLTISRP